MRSKTSLDWLNERTDEKIHLFGLEIELWRIGESPIAPKFNIVSQPNDWSRTVQNAARAAEELTEIKALHLRFWTAFKEYMEIAEARLMVVAATWMENRLLVAVCS